MFHNELQDFQKIKCYFYRVILIHLCTKLEKEIRYDIKKVAEDLNHPI